MITARTISLAHAVPIDRVIDERGISLRGKVERVGPCPICGGRDRFGINIRKNLFYCRRCNAGGGVIALVQFLDSCNFREACAALTDKRPSSGYKKPQRGPEHERQSGTDEYECRRLEKARWFWRKSKPAVGTPVETYLRARGIALPLPAMARFLPPHKPGHHPAMIIAYGLPQEPEPSLLNIAKDAITAVQVTLLKADGSNKAEVKPNKIAIASPAGKPMVLAPMNDLLGLAICEGVEDAISVHRATGLGAWASGGASFMPKLAPAVPDYIETATIFAHADEVGQRGALELADALIVRGIEVFIEGIVP